MKTYGLTELFDEKGQLATIDVHELAKSIALTEVKAIASDHENKLIRIEIGSAIRAIASLRGTSLIDAIADMNLCQTTHRAEKTYLKYCRIAGSSTLTEMAENPQVSLSVLDEIASCKKPGEPGDQGRFMRRVRKEVEDACTENLRDEGYAPEDDDKGRQIVLGVTRNQAVGVIRRVQIEMGVATKAGNGNSPERPKPEEINSKILQLLNLLRVMFLPAARRDAWLEKNGLLMADVGATMRSLQDALTTAGILTIEADDLNPDAVQGLKRLAAEQAV